MNTPNTPPEFVETQYGPLQVVLGAALGLMTTWTLGAYFFQLMETMSAM